MRGNPALAAFLNVLIANGPHISGTIHYCTVQWLTASMRKYQTAK